MSRLDATITTQIVIERDHRPGNTQVTQSHQKKSFDYPLDSAQDYDPIKILNENSEDNPNKAAVARQTLFYNLESITEFASRCVSREWKCISLLYYLQHDDGVLPRFAGLERRCNDTRGLLSHIQNHPRRPWHSDLRAILPGLLVIDCFSSQVVVADANCVYAALSYVWGKTGGGGEKGGFRAEFNSRNFPRTIRDAMNVVRVLGLKYLWVDRYCINDDEPETKHHMIRNMDAIYEAAYLTIIAAAGSDGDHGLPSVSRFHRAFTENATPPWDGIVYSEFSGPHLRQFMGSTYSTRGWTFQEDLLSQRRLIFTNDRATLYYGGEDRVRASYGIFGHINEYSQRSLTKPTDLLNAFLGVFRAYERLQPPVKHVWGIPFLLDRDAQVRQQGYGLLWRNKHPCSLRRISDLPSWTWAGWDGWSATDKPTVSLSFQPGPYGWLVDNVHLLLSTRAMEPNDISLDVLVGAQVTEISNYFRADRRPTSGKSEEPETVLHLTAWSTTVNVCVSLTGSVRFSDKDLNAAMFAVDPTPESLYRDEPLVNGHWTCQWTAAIICWGVKKAQPGVLRTQSLLLERVGDDAFRRVGVLEADWQKSDLDEHGHIAGLGRSFSRKCLRME